MSRSKTLPPSLRLFFTALLTSSMIACSGGGSEEPGTHAQLPQNEIESAYLRDQDGSQGRIGGAVVLEAPQVDFNNPNHLDFISVFWADQFGNPVGSAFFNSEANAPYAITIEPGTEIPDGARALLLVPRNAHGAAAEGTLVKFHDFTGNTLLSGPGGNASHTWQYGTDRPEIPIQRQSQPSGRCLLDNGLVSVIDMSNTRDSEWEAGSGSGQPNTSSDSTFPPYEFLCEDNPTHSERAVMDEDNVWTYSTLNDAMFYGTLAYDTFIKYLGEPALDDKLRLRVHYGAKTDQDVFWDGAYANFSDGLYTHYSMLSLDSVAHEIAHGVLNRISDLDFYASPLTEDALTLHEAFGDVSGVMAKYELTGNANNWIHGEESQGSIRTLNRIKTESDAIESFLDYEDAGSNEYLRIGMITYPFYLLAQQWGLEATYRVYLEAARNCWSASTTLPQAAECIRQAASSRGLAEADVIAAFKQVKIKLFDEGVLSHFYARRYKLRTEFSDDSRSTSQASTWLWDFGDGNQSTATNPEHRYATPGDYQVTLTVTDQAGDHDSFTRQISVTDEYCSIGSLATSNEISKVVIDGTDLSFSSSRSDYTQTPISLSDAANVALDIDGLNQATPYSTTWQVWIDLNDDGVFGDENAEEVLDLYVPSGQTYELTTSLDLSEIPYDGTPKYMRIIGDYAVIDACGSHLGQALDVRVAW